MAEPAQLQFSLKAILKATAAIACFFAAGAWFGIVGYLGVFLLAGLAALAIPELRRLQNYLLILAVVGVISCLLIPAPQYAPEAGRRDLCANNLKQIGLGLWNYHDVYGCFPPAYVSDANGKPMHTWRVLILPFVAEQALYDRYDFNEPWDGPKNSLLAKQMPAVFRCPRNAANRRTNSDYVAIVGPETIWQPDQGTTFAEIKDGSSNTIAVIEAAGLGVNWMEPRDLPFAAVDKGINPKHGSGISSHHPGAVIAMFADGHTQTIQENISLGTLKALFTKAGGEQIDEDY